MPIFDSHAHYDDRRFEAEFPGGKSGAIKAAYDAGVRRIVNVGSNIITSKSSLALTEKYDFIYAAVGIHPSDAQEIAAADVDRTLYDVESLAAMPKVVAVGEIGYDYHYDGTDKARQAYFFAAQLQIARKVKLPVIIHTRDAWGDTLDMLSENSDKSGVLHSFSGSAEVARQMATNGWYISFSGPLTYKNANKVKEAAAIVPDDRLLVETDCPYLPPHPHRGEINYSGYLKYTLEALAKVRGITCDTAAELTYRNACRFFRIE